MQCLSTFSLIPLNRNEYYYNFPQSPSFWPKIVQKWSKLVKIDDLCKINIFMDKKLDFCVKFDLL